MAKHPIEDRVDELYRTDRKRFVRERNELVKQLRADGDRAAAEAVEVLRKPTKAAWALNQVADAQPKLVAELRDLGGQLREGQRRAVARGETGSLREVSDRRRQVIRKLTDAAVEHAAESQRDQIEATLEAASVDTELGERLSRGRLATAHGRPSGVGGLEDLRIAGKAGPHRRDRVGIRQLKRDLRKVDEQLDRRQSELERAEERLDKARQAVDDAQRRVDDATSRRGELQEKLDEATR